MKDNLMRSMIEQIQSELQFMVTGEQQGYGLLMNHIERAEKQLVDLRSYVFRQYHVSGTVRQD